MTVTTVRNQLHRTIRDLVQPVGFAVGKLDDATEGFVRSGNACRQGIVIPVWDYTPQFQFTITLTIRLEIVEAIANLFSGVLLERQKDSNTCIINLKAIVPELDRLAVHNTTELGEVCHYLVPFVTDHILPFLDENRDLGGVNRLLNQDKSPEQIVGMSGRGSWVMWFVRSAIITARLARNPSFDHLVERYRDEIVVRSDRDRQAFEMLVEHLRSIPV